MHRLCPLCSPCASTMTIEKLKVIDRRSNYGAILLRAKVKDLTLTKSTARGEKSQACANKFGYVASRGNIVFPAPQPTW